MKGALKSLASPPKTTLACKHQRGKSEDRRFRGRQALTPRRRGDPLPTKAEMTAPVSVLAVKAKRVRLSGQPRLGWLANSRTTPPFAP